MEAFITHLSFSVPIRGPTEWKFILENIEDYPSHVYDILSSLNDDVITFPEVHSYIATRIFNNLILFSESRKSGVMRMKLLNILYNNFLPVTAAFFIQTVLSFNHDVLIDQEEFRWNSYIAKNNHEPTDKSYFPNALKEGLDSKDTRKRHEFLSLYLDPNSLSSRRPIPHFMEFLQQASKENNPEYLVQYLASYGKKWTWHQDNHFLQTLKFVKDWKPIRVPFKEAKDKFIQALHPIFLQVFFVSESCWYDSQEEPCSSCIDSSPNASLQWRCIAECEHGNRSCLRFAAPEFQFCKMHQKNPSQHFKKRICKDPCPSSDKRIAYKEDPYLSLSSSLLRYPTTHRPVTDMPHLVEGKQPYPVGFYLPVSRIDSLYYSRGSQESSQYCGKFFFYERDSSVYLHLGKSLFFATKLEAYMQLEHMRYMELARLDPKVKHNQKNRRKKNAEAWEATFEWVGEPDTTNSLFFRKNEYNANALDEFPQAIINKLQDCLDLEEDVDAFDLWDNWLHFHFQTPFLSLEDTFDCKYDICIPLFFPTIPTELKDNYGHKDTLMGAFDYLDQPICELAKGLGYDTILFQHEVGGHDCVTEIMHTNNYKSNLYSIDNIRSSLKGQLVLPKIWFPKDDGILFIGNDETKVHQYYDPRMVFDQFMIVPIVKEDGSGFMREYASEYEPQPLPRKRVYMHV
jgi:hypothetical protein